MKYSIESSFQFLSPFLRKNQKLSGPLCSSIFCRRFLMMSKGLKWITINNHHFEDPLKLWYFIAWSIYRIILGHRRRIPREAPKSNLRSGSLTIWQTTHIYYYNLASIYEKIFSQLHTNHLKVMNWKEFAQSASVVLVAITWAWFKFLDSF